MLLASIGWRAGVLVNTLQCTGQAITAKNHPAQKVSSAAAAETP